jgi:hypothetical protein
MAPVSGLLTTPTPQVKDHHTSSSASCTQIDDAGKLIKPFANCNGASVVIDHWVKNVGNMVVISKTTFSLRLARFSRPVYLIRVVSFQRLYVCTGN